MTLVAVLRSLERLNGTPEPPVSTDPFHLILWEQVAYLAPDVQRRVAYNALRKLTKLDPVRIRATPAGKLLEITRLGGAMAAPERAARIHESADIVLDRWNGDLGAALKLPIAAVRKALTAFPMIGEPGADKILVLTKTARLLPVDSNGLRVLQRLGIAREVKDYRASYRLAQKAVKSALPKSFESLANAFALLRQHGQELCRRSNPDCDACPLRGSCRYAGLARS